MLPCPFSTSCSVNQRMSQARAHLRRGLPVPGSVKEAALRFGFREAGRFAVDYRRLFGRSPSAALRARSGSAPAPAR